MPLVKVKPGLRHGYYDAEPKALAYYSAGDEFDASPAEMESFGDKFILVEESTPEPEPLTLVAKVDATRGAVELAREHSLSLALSEVTGTGAGGRITKADVQALLENIALSEQEVVKADTEAVLNGDAE